MLGVGFLMDIDWAAANCIPNVYDNITIMKRIINNGPNHLFDAQFHVYIIQCHVSEVNYRHLLYSLL